MTNYKFQMSIQCQMAKITKHNNQITNKAQIVKHKRRTVTIC